MKTSMKKKALISSVSMLSVAALALGTATYAWFTTSTEANANGISIGTSANSQLQISKAVGDWGTKINYGFTEDGTENGDAKILLPTSTVNGTNWFEGIAADGTKHDVDDAGFTAIQASNVSNYALVDQFNVRNSGSATLYGVTVEFTVDTGEISADGFDYFRMAVVPTNAKGEGKANVYEDGKGFFDYVVANSDQAYDAVKAAGVESASTVQSVATGTVNTLAGGKYTLNLGDFEANDAMYYNLYVWFEGQDEDCYDAHAGVQVPSITVKATCSKNA